MLFDYLCEHYDKGEPIFLTDLSIEGMTEENLRYHLKRMTDMGIICRFDAGVYYIPKVSLLGERIVISSDTVVRHKYLQRLGKCIGFYSGYTLANRLGLSTQVPMKEEITSNFAPAPLREITVKNRQYIIRRPVAEITEENRYVLQFLDCLKDIDQVSDIDLKSCGRILTEYAREHHITRELADRYISLYPLKVYKAIYETGVQYVSA